MDRWESRIRDYLAAHLEMIEPGLALVGKEFQLPNPMGAGGVIDILARDPLGHYVIVEIKRSDQAARAALHELTKYAALLKSSLGVRPERLRAILLSTEWHELAVPFAEYREVCEIPTEGRSIKATAAGIVTEMSGIEAPDVERPLTISRLQQIFLFERREARDACILKLSLVAPQAGARDFAIFSVDYEGGDRRVIHKHGAYFAFSSIAGSGRPSDEDLKEPDKNPDSRLLEKLLRYAGFAGDSSETSYPENLGALISDGWKISVASRMGRYETNRGLLTDSQLIAEAARFDGGAGYYLYCTASPRYRLSWGKVKGSAQRALLGNDAWSQILLSILDTVEREQPEATVSFSIYNPTNIVLSLGRLFAENDSRYLPGCQVVVSYQESVTIYVGVLAWNGLEVPLHGREWIEYSYGGLDEFMMMQAVHEQYVNDDQACARLGLLNVVFEMSRLGTPQTEVMIHSVDEGEMLREPVNELAPRSLAEFRERNEPFGVSLVQTLREFSVGWV